eukprot:scaffold3823_cov60-Phaeocystis_antarctica.AAC.2
MARANEQQKQQEKQKQQQKLKQKQQQQQKEQKKQKRKQKQQQNGGGETGAVSVDGVKARTHLPFAHTASSDITDAPLAESAKAKAAVTVPDKRRRQRRAESTAAVNPAEGAARRGHSPTSTSHGHRFDSELNRLAAETGCKIAEGGGNAIVLGETVQARLLPFPTRAQPTHAINQ